MMGQDVIPDSVMSGSSDALAEKAGPVLIDIGVDVEVRAPDEEKASAHFRRAVVRRLVTARVEGEHGEDS